MATTQVETQLHKHNDAGTPRPFNKVGHNDGTVVLTRRRIQHYKKKDAIWMLFYQENDTQW